MTFSKKIISNRLVWQVIHRGGESEINYINIFQNYKALEVSVEINYSEYQLMKYFLDSLQQGGRYSYKIARYQ